MQILVQDPAIMLAEVCASLVYGIYYSFFDVLPQGYINLHHLNAGQLGLTLLFIAIALISATCISY